jgi:hypothetical protein
MGPKRQWKKARVPEPRGQLKARLWPKLESWWIQDELNSNYL